MRIIQYIFILCLVSLFLSTPTSGLVVDSKNANNVNQQAVDYDEPDLAPIANSTLLIGVLIVALFSFLPKANLSFKKPFFIRGSLVF